MWIELEDDGCPARKCDDVVSVPWEMRRVGFSTVARVKCQLEIVHLQLVALALLC